MPPARIIVTSAGSLVLLLVNFPTAGYFMRSASDIMSNFNVTIENRSGNPVAQFRIGGSLMEEILIPAVEPGETVIRRLSVVHRWSIDCSAITSDAKQITGTYPESWRHHGYLIAIKKSGSITVVPNDGRKDLATLK